MKSKAASLLVALLITAGATAGAVSAQSGTTSTSLPGLITTCTASADVAAKRPGKALLCSVGYTVVPTATGVLLSVAARWAAEQDVPVVLSPLVSAAGITGGALFTLGTIVGPSMGHFYADATWRGVVGTGTRAVATGLIVVSATVILISTTLSGIVLFPPGEPVEPEYWNGWNVLLRIGTYTLLGSTLFDIATAPLSARRYNETRRTGLSITPRLNPIRRSAGLTLRFRF